MDGAGARLRPLRVRACAKHAVHECSCARAPRAGDESTANAKLLDVLRQVQCFGLALMRLDIRQESTRHTEVGFC